MLDVNDNDHSQHSFPRQPRYAERDFFGFRENVRDLLTEGYRNDGEREAERKRQR